MNQRIASRLGIALLFLGAIEGYTTFALNAGFRQLSPSGYLAATFGLCAFALGTYSAFLWMLLANNARAENRWLPTSIFGSFIAAKLVLTIFLLLEDVSRVLRGFVHLAMGRPFLVVHSALWAEVSAGAALLLFAAMLFGIWRGRHLYVVKRVILTYPNLPDGFDGLRIVQLSDIHSGSFSDAKGVARGVAMANALHPDLILFTGDLVNNRAEEIEPWIETFSSLSAPLGTYSILGNHDYGDYVEWASPQAKASNLQRLVANHARLGFHILNNTSIVLERNGSKITLAGVENWGAPPFPQYGDLRKALATADPNRFTILMSHDPSHWDMQVVDFPHLVALTLSGHTHAMQFGFDFGKYFRFSPVQFRYKRWAGLYRRGAKYLYVNRGFGFLGYHGRLGMWPEITELTLKRGH